MICACCREAVPCRLFPHLGLEDGTNDEPDNAVRGSWLCPDCWQPTIDRILRAVRGLLSIIPGEHR